MELVASYGVRELDALETAIYRPIARGFAAQLMAEFDIKMDTARRHIAKACRRQRHPNWTSPDEWGGLREGAGRKTE